MAPTSFSLFLWLVGLQFFPDRVVPSEALHQFVATTPGERGSDGHLDLWGSKSGGKVRCSHICQVDSADAEILEGKNPTY